MQTDIQTAKANLPVDKEQFSMKVGDKLYMDKKEAGTALVEMCKEEYPSICRCTCRKNVPKGEAGNDESKGCRRRNRKVYATKDKGKSRNL